MITEKQLLKKIKQTEAVCVVHNVNDSVYTKARLAFFSDGSSCTYAGITVPIAGKMKHWHNPKHQVSCINEVLWIEATTRAFLPNVHQAPCDLTRYQESSELKQIPGWNPCVAYWGDEAISIDAPIRRPPRDERLSTITVPPALLAFARKTLASGILRKVQYEPSQYIWLEQIADATTFTGAWITNGSALVMSDSMLTPESCAAYTLHDTQSYGLPIKTNLAAFMTAHAESITCDTYAGLFVWDICVPLVDGNRAHYLVYEPTEQVYFSAPDVRAVYHRWADGDDRTPIMVKRPPAICVADTVQYVDKAGAEHTFFTAALDVLRKLHINATVADNVNLAAVGSDSEGTLIALLAPRVN